MRESNCKASASLFFGVEAQAVNKAAAKTAAEQNK